MQHALRMETGNVIHILVSYFVPIPNPRECKSRVAYVPYHLRSELASRLGMRDEVFSAKNSLHFHSLRPQSHTSPWPLNEYQDALSPLASGLTQLSRLYCQCLASTSSRLQMRTTLALSLLLSSRHLLKLRRAQMTVVGLRPRSGVNSTTHSAASSLQMYLQQLFAIQVQILMHRLVQQWVWS